VPQRYKLNLPLGVPDSLDHDAGLSPDAPTTVTKHGGKQSYLGVDFTQLDAGVMFEAAATMHQGGEKYGRDNWKAIEVEDHINHALTHLYGWLKGDRQDDHLVHALVRAMMARVVERDGLQLHG
jgi:hypothetical protein